MKILKNKNKTVLFENLDIGEVFYAPNIEYLYMKTEQGMFNNCITNAVNLNDGRYAMFFADNLVELANGHIEDD